mmetsp:Transcript_4327/g.7460  ORF Transcript_4327/g.7460 Transcript_4327/m.7460 type:complete len:182 (-) Transcript_4327:1777-2322(-)
MMRRHGSVDRIPSTPNTPSRPLRRIHSRTLSNMSDIMADMRYLPLRKKSFWYLYLTTLFLSYLVLLLFTDAGLAFTWLNLGHACVTFPWLHWLRIQQFDKQNIYDSDSSDRFGSEEPQTYWENIDNGKQWTNTRKWLVVIPLLLYLMATNSADFTRQPLLLNLVAMLACIIPKLRKDNTID